MTSERRRLVEFYKEGNHEDNFTHKTANMSFIVRKAVFNIFDLKPGCAVTEDIWSDA